MNKIIQIILLSAIMIYLFYGFNISKIDFSIFSYLGIFITLFTIFLGQIVLTLRWMKISTMSFNISFETIIVSSALNMILPAKLGEFSKAVYLKKFYNYNYHRTLSILFIEKFYDIIMLFLLTCYLAYSYFSDNIVKNSILVLAIFIVLIILFFNSKIVLNIFKKVPIQLIRVYGQKIYKNINKLLKTPFDAFLYTGLLWIMYFLGTLFFFMYAVDFSLNFKDVLELFIFSTIALSIPLAPAGLGTYEGIVVLFLSHHGVSKESALISASIYHALLFIVDFVLLYIFLFIKDLKLKDLTKK
ncbi:MAG: lysylphosphatidylglycerol synthase transmembrane domain-containing protein [Sulfurospirillaceae bacterium]|nr:lysylphosphatidylglycerol synthase transmembrane domain-containing protein [Sulfurospirillaceae bacterium]